MFFEVGVFGGRQVNTLTFKHFYTGLPEPSFVAKHEDNLFKDLFQDYERWVRPVEHLNDKIKIKFGLAISQLVDVVGVHIMTYFISYGLPEGIVGAQTPCEAAGMAKVDETVILLKEYSREKELLRERPRNALFL